MREDVRYLADRIGAPHLEPEALAQCAAQTLLWRLAREQIASGKLPHPGHQAPRGPLDHEPAPSPFELRADRLDSLLHGASGLDREILGVARAPCGFNVGMIFIPGENTWHSFQERPLDGVRRSLMVNYVKDEWRSTNELAFPHAPIQ